MRDSGPVFRVDGSGRQDAVGLNFDGWGGAQRAGHDRLVAAGVARWTGLPFSRAGVVAEGGAIETDGDGTVMATESSLVDADRNPGATREQVEAAVLAAYGADTMIWLPGIRDRDITDDHVDATSRFVRPGVVMVQVPPDSRTDVWAADARLQREILSGSVDARGRRLRVVPVAGPTVLPSSAPGFLDSYVNFHAVNGAVVTAAFGDAEADAACADVLAAAFPGRVVEQIRVDRLHAGGGGIHCVTAEQPDSAAPSTGETPSRIGCVPSWMSRRRGRGPPSSLSTSSPGSPGATTGWACCCRSARTGAGGPPMLDPVAASEPDTVLDVASGTAGRARRSRRRARARFVGVDLTEPMLPGRSATAAPRPARRPGTSRGRPGRAPAVPRRDLRRADGDLPPSLRGGPGGHRARARARPPTRWGMSSLDFSVPRTRSAPGLVLLHRLLLPLRRFLTGGPDGSGSGGSSAHRSPSTTSATRSPGTSRRGRPRDLSTCRCGG